MAIKLKLFLFISCLMFGMIYESNIAAAAELYYVQPGDSIYGIAKRFNANTTVIKAINGLESDLIYPGQALKITKQHEVIHQVQAGENLYQIARKYHTTVETLKEINKLADEKIFVNQRLIIIASEQKQNKLTNQTNTYTVQEGDNLFQIAKKSQISIESLCEINNITETTIIKPGQILQLTEISSIHSNIYKNIMISESEIDLLARLVTAESKGESLEGQVAVVATVFNRVLDSRYPNSVYDVIYHIYKGRYQFSPISDGRIDMPAVPSAYEAIQLALNGWDPSKGARGFYNPAKSSDTWVREQTVSATIGNHVFIIF